MVHFRGLILLSAVIGLSQPVFSNIPIGTWRTHYSYNNVSQVVSTDDLLYGVANAKLFSVDVKGTVETYSSLTGLNGFDIACIGWNEKAAALLVVYSDGNMDFISKSGIDNLPDFKNKSMTSDKTVYSLRMQNGYAYLSTGVGLLVIDVRSRQIVDTYKPLLNSQTFTVMDTVYDAVSTDDSIFLATPQGLFGGNVSSNLLDPSQWSPLSFPANTAPVSLVLFSGQLTALASNGTVYRKSGNNWIQLLYDNQAQKLISDGNYLYICTSANCYMYDATWNQTRLSVPSYDVSYNDATTTLYIASGSQGLLPFRQKNGQFVKDASAIVPNGPSQVFAWNTFFKDGVYYSTPGARWGDRNHIDGDIMSFDGENWSVLKGRDSIPYKTGCQFKDILNLAIDPNDNGHFFLTSWGEGLYEFRDSTFYKLHNQYNSSLITVLPGPFCRVDGARFDHSGNLWVLNSTYGLYSGMSDTTLWALKPDGSWHGFYYANMPPAPTWGSILVTSLDQMWINSVRGISYGIFVVDQNGTPWNTADDKTRWFSSFPVEDNATLSPAAINCITEDKNGTIWIGTKEGPILATNPSNVFDTDFSFNRVLIPRNDGTGYGDYLLKDVWVTCITVDGANRKWIGTSENGLYLVSSDGLTTIHRFTTENSPLPSDHILSIAIHPETGEVFVGTSAGLVSYRSDAIEGKETYQAVRVFPNPVKPSYSGQITVTGLKENSTVKITDLSGNLLVSGISLGGQFCWNGLNKQGKRVASGVYLVFCSSEDGTEYQTCKFMVVN